MLLFPVLLLKFVLIFSGFFEYKKVRILYYTFSWIIPAILSFKSVTENAVFNEYPSGNWLFFMLTEAIYNLFSTSLMLYWWKKTRIKREKKQAKIYVYVSIFTIIISTFADIYAGENHLPPLATTTALFWIITLLYIIVKYRFIQLTPKLISRDILNSVDEIVLLFDQNNKIIFINESGQKLLGFRPETLDDLDAYVLDYLHYDELIKGFITGDNSQISTKVIFKFTTGDRTFDVRFKKVYDGSGDVLGILCVANEIKGLEYFTKQFKLTEREKQITLNIASGIRNLDIANKLNIAERTVKAHVTNIYNKLGVNNKIELFNLLLEFNIFSSLDNPCEDSIAGCESDPVI